MHIASSTLVANVGTALGSLVMTNMDQLWTIVLVVVAIPLAFYILNKIVSFVKRTAK